MKCLRANSEIKLINNAVLKTGTTLTVIMHRNDQGRQAGKDFICSEYSQIVLVLIRVSVFFVLI